MLQTKCWNVDPNQCPSPLTYSLTSDKPTYFTLRLEMFVEVKQYAGFKFSLTHYQSCHFIKRLHHQPHFDW